MALTFALLYWINSKSVSWVLESERIGRVATEARALAFERNAAIRGYLLSRHQISLVPEFTARVALHSRLDLLGEITAGDPAHQDRARAIEAAVERWERGWAFPVLAQGAAASVDTGIEPAGKELFDSVRSAFDSFLAADERMRARGLLLRSRLQTGTITAVLMELALLIGVLVWLGRRTFVHAREVLQQRKTLEAQTEDLEQQAATLEEQAVQLEEQNDEAMKVAQSLESANRDLEASIARLEDVESIAQRAKSRHEEAQGLLDFVLTNSPVGVALFDRDLRFIRVNTVMASITGKPVEGHPGRLLHDVTSEDLADSIEPMLGRVLETGTPVTNVPVSTSSESDRFAERHLLCSFFPVSLPGRTVGVGAVILETTQYRLLEEQLLQAQKMEAVGRLAGGVAHDFNNMLTAIRSYSELLIVDMEPESQAFADMTEVINAAERATVLTKKLLAFSRQQVLRPALVDLNTAIDGIRNMLGQIAGKNIDLVCKLSPDLWTVRADPTEIERVITNLVLNAHDAMPEGGRLVIETSNVDIDDEYAETHADTQPGSYAMISVTDTGTGMTKEVREKVFEPFFTTKEKGKGTGLGLPSVYGIVKQSGGFVWVYSEPGRGTTFKIYLPRAIEEEKQASVNTPRGNRQVGAETILLVEDDDEVRNVALRILRRNGYRVLEASNGADALKVCEAEGSAVDLVVTDIVMPEMGGSELAEKIRETQPDARILFTSGFTEDAAVRQSFLKPGEAFIEKPFTPATLAKKARQVLDGSDFEKEE
ncbi:MAG: ATP-binding protein [Gemmatimonadaceae bacterium]